MVHVLERRNSSRYVLVTDEKWFYKRPIGNHKTRRSWVGPDGDQQQILQRTISDKKHMVLMAVNFSGLYLLQNF